MAKKEDDDLKKSLNEINIEVAVNSKERGISRTRYAPFSRYCFWLLQRYSDGEKIFYPNDLCKFAKVTYNTAYRFFEDLTNLSYSKKISTGNLIYFELLTNDGHIKLYELLPYIKKTLTRK